MGTLTESVDVDVPVRTAYDQWTQFEKFPRFLEGVTGHPAADPDHDAPSTDIAGR